ncbi:MAG TPA: thiamine-phosphate kinase [Desulfobacteraceae bacterium]|nr:thiamine-phosphate kinase [Desulfobacteraceae bacterium]
MTRLEDKRNTVSKTDLKMKDIGEFGFIRSIMDNCNFSCKKVIKGIGDDCAVIGPYEGKLLLITTDLLVEDVHFILKEVLSEDLGRKAVAVNLSDIAAMGGKALHLFVSLATPRSMRLEIIHSIYKGIKAMCRRYGINILGGDTSASPEKLMISITAIGQVPENEVLFRNGAGPGDHIYVSGTLGDSAAGLNLIKGKFSAPEAVAGYLKEAHNNPIPFLRAGRMIAHSRLASAMIDLSDGLLFDLSHICEESKVGARLFHGVLPLSDELKTLAEINKFDPYKLALTGGEDYRLLVTVPYMNLELFQKLFKKGSTCPVYHIGEINKESGIKITRPDGSEDLTEIKGFDHFITP